VTGVPVEEERKFGADPAFALPDLTGCLPPGGELAGPATVTLTATYHDTADLRLARAGASLRYRAGDQPPWTVKLPTQVPGVRHEISQPGRPDAPPPAELVALVTVLTRGAPLRPVVTVRSARQRYELRDAGGTVLAELVDDQVSVLDGAQPRGEFRELEVERVADGGDLLDRVAAVLTGAGAVAGEFVPKQVRALSLLPGLAGTVAAPPDLPAPEPVPRQPRCRDVVTRAVRRSVARILAHDPLIRLREDLPGGDTPVHQMRVGLRRLRSDLRTFEQLVDQRWARPLRRELRWLADRLGAARDAEVLRARLRRTAAADPLAPVDAAAVARCDAALAAREGEARRALDRALRSDRYLVLLDALIAAARQPGFTALADAPAREVLPGLVAEPWRAFAYGDGGVDGAADLAADAPDRQWHAVRVRGKRARYAVEAVAEVVGGEAPSLARKLAAVQELLGEHQDAAVAGQTWLAIADSDPDDHPLAVATGRLYERERVAIRRARGQFPAAWRSATKPRLLSWLS
jgi:CHAD domain-containing protein